jgi:hypothetical protein
MSRQSHLAVLVVLLLACAAEAQDKTLTNILNEYFGNASSILGESNASSKPAVSETGGRPRPGYVGRYKHLNWTNENGTWVTNGEHRIYATTSTTASANPPPLCGGTDAYCSVEFDSTGDGRPECCTGENNPVCAGCLGYCLDYCGKGFVGLSSCFMDNSSQPMCQCSQAGPTCNARAYVPTTSETQPGNTGPGNTIYYLLSFGCILAAIAFASAFTRRT